MEVNPRLQIICFVLIIGMLFLCFLRVWYLDLINIVLGGTVFYVTNVDLIHKIGKKIQKIVKKKGKKKEKKTVEETGEE